MMSSRANCTVLHAYEAPAHAGKPTATLARWDVDAKGIHDSGYGKVASFKDPDGNTFALEQV
jgi:hypothetical protein